MLRAQDKKKCGMLIEMFFDVIWGFDSDYNLSERR